MHESDRSPIEMDTAQCLITFSQESVIREAYSPQRSTQSLIQFSEETAAIGQSHSPEKATLNSDEDIIIKEEKEDEAVIKMIRRQDFEKVMENINSLSHINDKNVTGEQKGDGSPVEEGNDIGGSAENEGDITGGEQKGDGSPMEELNGIGGSTEEEGDITGEQKADGSPVEEGNGIGGSAEEEGDITGGEQKGEGSLVEEGNGIGGSTEEERDVTGEQKGDGSPVEEGNGIGGSAEEEGDGTVEEIGHGINTETSIDDDQEGEQLEFEDKELAIYW